MKIVEEFVLSLFSYSKALKVIVPYNLVKYLVVLVVLLSLFVFPIILLGEFISFITSYVPFVDGEKYANTGASFLSSISGFFLLLMLIPVFSLVSGQVNQHLRGVNNSFSLQQFISDILRGVKMTIRNLVYQFFTIVLLLLLLRVFSESLLFSVIGNIVIMLVTSYFYGFSLLDYAMENHQMDYKSSVSFVRSHIGLVLGLGVVYYSIVRLNDLYVFKVMFGDISVYWSAFAEAIVAFVGVIAANIILNIMRK